MNLNDRKDAKNENQSEYRSSNNIDDDDGYDEDKDAEDEDPICIELQFEEDVSFYAFHRLSNVLHLFCLSFLTIKDNFFIHASPLA